MKPLIEPIKIVSMLAALGAAVWAGLAVISAAEEFGGSGDPSSALWSAGTVFVVAVNLIAGCLAREKN